jgi:crotonobetainyl-CoA:carnitine CoA-transferase CaiB-like acyl-CoA transferase
MLTNEHLKAREMMVEIEHPEYGPMTLPGCPIKVSDGSITFTPAPLLGADNAAVYGKLLGLDGKRLQELQAQGVI